RSIGTENIDFRLRQLDAELDTVLKGAPWLGMPVAELNTLDRVLVVGSFLRKDHPLMAQRLRQACKQGCQVSFIEAAGDDPLFPVANRLAVAPSQLADALAEVLVAVLAAAGQAVPAGLEGVQPRDEARAIAQSLASGQRVAVFLGNAAVNSPVASTIAANASALAAATNGRFGFLTAGGNTVGGYLAGAIPGAGGLTAEKML